MRPFAKIRRGRRILSTLRRAVTARCLTMVGAPWFSIAGFTVILVNAMCLGLETYSWAAAVGPYLKLVEHLCIAGFVCELLIRFGASLDRPSAFFRDGWNIFDMAIILAPLLPGIRENVTLLRLLRLARIVRAFRLFPSLRIILIGLRRSLPGLGSFLLITVLVIYGYAMLGWMLFGRAEPDRYGTVGQAMLSLFLLLSLDGITDTLVAGREITPWAVPYYVSYMVAACYLLTNLLVGVVLTALQEAHDAERAAARGKESGPPIPTADNTPHQQIAKLREALDALESQLTTTPPQPRTPETPLEVVRPGSS
ncbi:ion transporter [Actinoplanes sp. G11-F43]|uniref:ion transporter n=1 Tax=Actinoplanes sp. G11-F43 TaxID=3424130 RepID=UPI003D329305